MEVDAMLASRRGLTVATLAACTLSGNPSRVEGAAAVLAPSTPPESTVWQPHQAAFDYVGITSRFSCDGLESKVRQLLLYLGARKGLTVRASGCGLGDFPASGVVRISVEFQTLSLAPDTTGTALVRGNWTPLRLRAGRPRFMESGDCELVAQMHRFLTDNFSVRNLDYAASCTPHEVYIDSFDVQGEILKATPADAG